MFPQTLTEALEQKAHFVEMGWPWEAEPKGKRTPNLVACLSCIHTKYLQTQGAGT